MGKVKFFSKNSTRKTGQIYGKNKTFTPTLYRPSYYYKLSHRCNNKVETVKLL